MKLQVDITVPHLAAAIGALEDITARLDEGEERGTLDYGDTTGLFELLDSQPAAE